MSDTLLQAKDIVREFDIRQPGGLFRKKRQLRALDGVSFSVSAGETLGLVGESGCGKSTMANIVLGMLAPTSGQVLFNGEDLARVSKPRWRELRLDMQMIFQDPMGALNWRHTVGDQLIEPMVIHGIGLPEQRRDRAERMLESVGLSPVYMDRYPHELSGGQRQRLVIARALMLGPKLIVCDEPVSALDVSVQAQVLEVLEHLQRDLGIGYLFISHDLKVVRYLCDRVAVMYLGRIVEIAPVDKLFASPQHPYTQALVDAIPQITRSRSRRRILQGDPPSPIDLPRGCRFQDRCHAVQPTCREKDPALKILGRPSEKIDGEPARDAHAVACHVVHGEA